MSVINPVSNNIINFSSNKNNKPPVLYRTYKTEATSGKKWGVGIASFILPGSGQAINNEWGKALGFFGLAGVAPYIIAAISGIGMSFGLTNPKGSKAVTVAGLSGLIASWLAAVGGRVWACVDAVKNAKSEIEVPIK